MKVMLLVNPYASGVDWKSRMQANSALLAGHDLTTVETTKRDHATDLATPPSAATKHALSSCSGSSIERSAR